MSAAVHRQTLAHRAQNIALTLIFVGIFTSTPTDTDVSELFIFFNAISDLSPNTFSL